MFDLAAAGPLLLRTINDLTWNGTVKVQGSVSTQGIRLLGAAMSESSVLSVIGELQIELKRSASRVAALSGLITTAGLPNNITFTDTELNGNLKLSQVMVGRASRILVSSRRILTLADGTVLPNKAQIGGSSNGIVVLEQCTVTNPNMQPIDVCMLSPRAARPPAARLVLRCC